MAGLSVSVQAAGSSKGAGDLRALSTEIRLELVVRVAEHLAGRADCAANRAGPATRVGGCSAIVRGQSLSEGAAAASARGAVAVLVCRDRKSTRLNSSHVSTSYAVFCLKKK